MSGFDLPPLLGSQQSLGQLPRLIGEGPRPQTGQGEVESAGSFPGALADQIADVSALQAGVSQDTKDMAMGKNVGMDKLMMSIGKSEVAFNLMLEVRNKLIDAWDKLSRSVV